MKICDNGNDTFSKSKVHAPWFLDRSQQRYANLTGATCHTISAYIY